MADIQLIPLAEEHLEMVRNWRNSPEVSQYMFTDQQITPEEQKAWFARVKDDPTQHYFVIHYEGRDLGLASVNQISTVFSSCLWAFYLGDTSTRGAGIGSKVEFRMIEYVFNELKLNKLRGEVLYHNEKVLQMHAKFGFQREGYFRDHVKKNGKFVDVVPIGLLKRDWQIYKPALEEKIYRRK